MKMAQEFSAVLYIGNTGTKVYRPGRSVCVIYRPYILPLLSDGELVKKDFAYVDESDNFSFTYKPGFDDVEIFPGERYFKPMTMMPHKGEISINWPSKP